MKVICGLGNPGPEYEWTRHNVGWWVLEGAQRAWGLPPFRQGGAVRASAGRIGEHEVHLIEPLTYMNRSGQVLAPLLQHPEFDISRDLLIVVDDTAMDVGRVRFRAAGSSGGHNGLKSVEAVLGTQAYARLKIGVGAPPPEVALAEWVLSEFDTDEQEKRVRALADELPEALRVWLDEGVQAAGNRYNR